MVEDLVKSLKGFGCASKAERMVFATKLRKVLLRLATCEGEASPMRELQVPGSLRDKREILIREVALGFGADNDEARAFTRLVLASNSKTIGEFTRAGGFRVKRNRLWCMLTARITWLHLDAIALYGRLQGLLEELRKPYRGTASDPDAGVEQVVELLQRFPDLADTIYRKAGFNNVTAFPPRTSGLASTAEEMFAEAVEAHLDDEWWSSTFKLAGLVVASIAITVVTAGALGPLAATLVGSGIGLTQGVIEVTDAHGKLQATRDAHTFGAATDESVKHALGEVQGAWGMLLVNTATGGLIGRFGGGPAVSNAMKMLRISVISGVGNGLATATNPNVWRAQNTAGLILFATVIGGASGVGGHLVAVGTTRLIPTLGAKIQIGVSKLNGHLEKGKTVKVQLRPGESTVEAKVVAVNKADSTVMLEVKGQNLHVRVGKVAKIQGSVFHDEALLKALRPMKDEDFKPRYTEVYRPRGGKEPELGIACRNPDGSISFVGDDSIPIKVKLSDLRVFEKAALVPPKTMPKKDFDHFRSSSQNYRIAPLANRKGYYTAFNHNRCYGQPKLTIVPGHKMDHNGAFKSWSWEGLPEFRMKVLGKKSVLPSPTADEVALFSAHGCSFGFTGMSTRKAARSVVDAIVDANTRFNKTSIRFCAISSCGQGNRRFILLGKTNAESFQQHVDMRLLELGINPKGAKGITVLASDRMGSLSGADRITTFFRKKQRTTFVPAGTQRPLSYGRDVANLGAEVFMGGVTVMGIVLASATGGLVVVAANDPEEFVAIVEKLKEHIVGVIFDAPLEKSAPDQQFKAVE